MTNQDKPEFDLEDEDDLRARFNTYNPDDDPNGSIGIGLAEAAMKRFGYDTKKVQQWANSARNSFERVSLERIARAALSRFSELQNGESVGDGEIAAKLSAIRSAGYEVPAYSHLSKDEKWELLTRIRSEVGTKLQREYPDIARQIQSENQRRIDDVELCR